MREFCTTASAMIAGLFTSLPFLAEGLDHLMHCSIHRGGCQNYPESVQSIHEGLSLLVMLQFMFIGQYLWIAGIITICLSFAALYLIDYHRPAHRPVILAFLSFVNLVCLISGVATVLQFFNV